MVHTKHKYLIPWVLFFGSVTCATLGSKTADEITPTAKSITIYRNGGSVVSGVIDSATVGLRRLRLPATAAAINLYQDNESLKWFTTQVIQEEAKKDAAPVVEKYLLVGLPSLKSGDVQFNYEVPEIFWHPQLVATITDKKTLSLQLQAVIRMGANQMYKNCNVTLVLSNALIVERTSAYTFSLNSFDLYPFRDIVYNLDNKTLEYSFLREWRTYEGKDDVHVLIQVKNPFSIDLNQSSFFVEFNKTNVDSGSINNQIRPGEVLSLGAGIDDTIFTFRSVKITETPGRKPLPFNHKISYEITNKSDQEKTLRLVSSRVTGSEHRSVYHFKRQPDATPENTLIWILTLKPGSTQTLEYDYDADIKDVPYENGFEAGG